jgi:UTP:GlnB (protein PII) uridylyltransferase
VASELPSDGVVWVAVGSQARRELTPASLARGAVVYSEPPSLRWKESVSGALASCGLPAAVIARTGQEWRATNGDDELALTVLVERRALWGTPREPLPIAEGEARERVLEALARRALAYTRRPDSTPTPCWSGMGRAAIGSTSAARP